MLVAQFSRRRPLLMMVAAFLELFSASYFLSSSASSFAPTAAPSFPSFSDTIVGSWKTSKAELSVEEVMRSCGGAVQGVREVAITTTDVDNKGYYLNRANDGFVYFDCGSYTVGPTQLDRDKEHRFLCSLRHVGQSSCRVLVDFTIQEDFQACGTRVFYLSKKALQVPPQIILFEQLPPHFAIDWKFELRCRMASTSQLWNLQRAKWESALHGVSEVATTNESSDNEASSTVYVWVAPTQTKDGSKSIATCLVDPTFKCAVALVRDYNESGSLIAVTQKKGTLVS